MKFETWQKGAGAIMYSRHESERSDGFNSQFKGAAGLVSLPCFEVNVGPMWLSQVFCTYFVKNNKTCAILLGHNDKFIPASLWVRDTEQKSNMALKLCKDPAVSYGS